jgi:signal transduction histidine kinase
MISMRKRARLAGGKSEVTSALVHGMIVTSSFPMELYA